MTTFRAINIIVTGASEKFIYKKIWAKLMKRNLAVVVFLPAVNGAGAVQLLGKDQP